MPDDKNDKRSPLLRIRNSLTDADGDDKQIAFKKQKMSVATLPNRQGEYGYVEDAMPGGPVRQSQSKIKEKDTDQEARSWIGGAGPVRPGMSGRKRVPMI